MFSSEGLRANVRNENARTESPETREFAQFVQKVEKSEQRKKFKEILKNYPEVSDIIKEKERLEKNIDEIIDECEILRIEKLSLESKFNEIKQSATLKEIESLRRELSKKNVTINELTEKHAEVCNKFNNLMVHYQQIKKDNEKLSKKNGVFDILATSAEISLLRAKIKSLESERDKLLKRNSIQCIRAPISEDLQAQIVELRREGLSYSQIAQKLHVSQSTVCKYVGRFL